jgi:hypothetical protein
MLFLKSYVLILMFLRLLFYVYFLRPADEQRQEYEWVRGLSLTGVMDGEIYLMSTQYEEDCRTALFSVSEWNHR